MTVVLGLRAKMTSCAVELAKSVKYGSAGTVEYERPPVDPREILDPYLLQIPGGRLDR